MKKTIRPAISGDIFKQFSDLLFTNQEAGITHNPFDQELREMTGIEQGDPDSLQKSLDEDYPGKVGRLAKDDLRNAKNLAIVNVTLSCRAAIRGGVMPEIAFSLSDTLIQKVEESNDIHTVHELMTALKYQYAHMVADIKRTQKAGGIRQENYHEKRSKDYIITHLHGRLSLSQIAEALSLNASYLSELFHRCEGISITEFIRKQKLGRAQNLLMYSDHSYSEIASCLGYSSQSHFGRQFKALTGMTPHRYRELYGVTHLKTDGR